jgi:hypothetical protein
MSEIIHEVMIMIQNPRDAASGFNPDMEALWTRNKDEHDRQVLKSIERCGIVAPSFESLKARWKCNIEDAEWDGDWDDGDYAIPRQYICPITREVMRIPVFSPTTKRNYEKDALKRLLGRERERAKCPETGKEFNMAVHMDLPVNTTLANLIKEWMKTRYY